MNPYLTQHLLDKYPKLFSNKQFWGFECGDGWSDILDHLCGSIVSYKNPDNDNNEILVAQVKEKFGQLRFYADYTDRMVDGMIWMAEHMSGYTCERCGNPGELRTNGWMVTLCDKHHDERIMKES